MYIGRVDQITEFEFLILFNYAGGWRGRQGFVVAVCVAEETLASNFIAVHFLQS